MKLKKLSHYLKMIEDSVSDIHQNIIGVDAFYFHSGKWFSDIKADIKDKTELARLESTRNSSERMYKAKNEHSSYFWVASYNAVVRVKFSSAIRKPSQLKVREFLDKTMLYARDNFRANHDGLTELYNRSSYEEYLLRVIALPEINKGAASSDSTNKTALVQDSVCLLALDIDHFKSANDTYGHLYGDVVLCAFAWRLENEVDRIRKAYEGRIEAQVFRQGGEEFQITLVGKIFAEEAIDIADSVLRAINGEVLPSDEEVKVLEGDGRATDIVIPHIADRKITCSIGLAISSQVNSSLARERVTLLKNQADTALYSAKAGGRDRARFFPKILESFGRVIEVHDTSGTIAIDIGKDVGVLEGQEFFVVPEGFDGNTDFYTGEGRSRKRLGKYPKFHAGRLVVFNVQKEMSFCHFVDKERGVRKITAGSTLEAIPLGSISHLLRSGVQFGSKDLDNLDDLRQHLKNLKDLSNSWVVSIVIKDFAGITVSKGPGFANQVLATVFQDINEDFVSGVRLSQIELGNMIALISRNNEDDVASKLAARADLWFTKFDGLLTIAIGFCSGGSEWLLNDAVEDKPSSLLDFAVAASAGAVVYEERWNEFSPKSVDALLWSARLDRQYDRGIADFEKFSALSIESPNILNAIGLIYFEKPSPDLTLAESYLKRAIALEDDIDNVIASNLALVNLEKSDSAEAFKIFNRLLDEDGYVPNHYEGAVLYSAFLHLDSVEFLGFCAKHSALVTEVREKANQQIRVSLSLIQGIFASIDAGDAAAPVEI